MISLILTQPFFPPGVTNSSGNDCSELWVTEAAKKATTMLQPASDQAKFIRKHADKVSSSVHPLLLITR